MTEKFRISRCFALFLVLVAALWVRAYRLDEAFDGYHGFNEGWYAIVAENYVGGSPLRPISYDGKPDYNIPPLFSWAVWAVFKTAGRGEAQARAVSVFFSLVLALCVYGLGARLYGERGGLAAAALTALMPVSVLTGRNAQTDMTFVALLLAFLWAYTVARDSRGAGRMALAGALLGCAALAKQPAALALPAVIVWELVSMRNTRFFDRRFAAMLAAAAAVLSVFYGLHLLLNGAEILNAQSGGAARLAKAPDTALAAMLLKEVWIGMSPPAALLLIPAFARGVFQLRGPAGLPVIGFLFYAVFFAFLHKHTYYMLPATVFAALMVGGLFGGEPRRWKAPLAAALTVVALIASLLVLCRVKYGWHAFEQFGNKLEARAPAGVDIVTNDMLLANYGPLIKYYAPESRVFDFGALPIGRDGVAELDYSRGVVLLFDSIDPFRIPDKMLMNAGMDVMGLEVFGATIHTLHTYSEPNPHIFGGSRFVVKKTGGPLSFGVRRVESRDAIKFAWLPPVYRLKLVDGRVKVILSK